MERSEAGGLPCGGWRVVILSARRATIRFPFNGKTRSSRYLLVVPGVVRLPGARREARAEAGACASRAAGDRRHHGHFARAVVAGALHRYASSSDNAS